LQSAGAPPLPVLFAPALPPAPAAGEPPLSADDSPELPHPSQKEAASTIAIDRAREVISVVLPLSSLQRAGNAAQIDRGPSSSKRRHFDTPRRNRECPQAVGRTSSR